MPRDPPVFPSRIQGTPLRNSLTQDSSGSRPFRSGEPLSPLLIRAVKFGFSPKPAREIVCDGLRKRGNDRLLRLQRGGTLGIDSHRRLLCRTRSRGTSHRREGLGSVSLVDRRRHCDGYRHLGNAFQGDACLPLASAGELLLADRSAVSAGRHFSFGLRAVCSEPAETGLGSRFDR